MFDTIVNVINQMDKMVWGWWMIFLLLGTHIFMTIRTGFIQRKIGKAIRLSVTKDPDAEGEVSQFGALTTALASTIGTGNIIAWEPRSVGRARRCFLVLDHRCFWDRNQVQ